MEMLNELNLINKLKKLNFWKWTEMKKRNDFNVNERLEINE